MAAADESVAGEDRVAAGHRAANVLLILAALAIVGWTHTLPLALAPLDDYARLVIPASSASRSLAKANTSARVAFAATLKSQFEYRGADNQLHVFLGDSDSYYWLRMARNLLRTGTVCDATVNGRCWDNLARAPLGRPYRYPYSLHVFAIGALHRLISYFRPGYPLPATSFWVPAIIGTLGMLPAFGIGSRLGGPVGGFAAATIIGLNPLFLDRSIGSDNDVWNVVIPIAVLWAVMTALASPYKMRQVAYSLLAALLTALHAATWTGWIFAYYAILLGLVAQLILQAIHSKYASSCVRHSMPRTALVACTFCVAAAIAIAATTDSPLGLIANPLHQLPSLGVSKLSQGRSSLWPDPFTANAAMTVNEMAPLDLGGIAKVLGGRCYLLLGCLGLLIMLMPPSRWTRRHYALLFATFLLDTLVVSFVRAASAAVLIPLSLGPIVAILLSIFEEPASIDHWRGTELIIAVWFSTGMFLMFEGSRFVIVVLPAFGFGCAVLIGAIQRWLARTISHFTSLNSAVVKGLSIVALAPIVAVPIYRGSNAARAYIPEMNIAWWDVLSQIREQSPFNSIVICWWDYGYWAEYVSERRVLADGGSLRTHIPYWIAKALLAPSERQTVGLLRMLECGSDTGSEGERGSGAYAELRSDGLSDIAAGDAVLMLAQLDTSGASGYLSRLGLSSEAAQKVFAATNCLPPPSYLVLSSRLNEIPGWRYAGNWDFRRAFIVAHSRDSGKGTSDSVAVELGYDRSTTRTLVEKARALSTPADVEDFISSSDGYLVDHWLPCVPGQNDLVCAIDDLNGVEVARNVRLTAILVHPGDPARASMRMSRAGFGKHAARVDEVAAGRLLIATDGHLTKVAYRDSAYPDTTIIFDAAKRRVLVGPRYLIESTFTRLMFLDAAYSRLFEKIDDRLGYGDERVRVWKIDWSGGPRPPSS
jgi:hypothetical protein